MIDEQSQRVDTTIRLRPLSHRGWRAMDVDFMLSMNFPRTSSNPGEIGAVELGYRTVMSFSQIDSAPGKCGAVELDFRRPSFPPRVAR